MQITRRGMKRHAGWKVLAEENFSSLKPTQYRKPWSAKEATVTCEISVPGRPSSYVYDVSFSADELFRFLELGVGACAKDRVGRSIGKAAIATLRELLAPIKT